MNERPRIFPPHTRLCLLITPPSIVLPMSSRKRVEKQLQEVNERSEKKRLEVLSIQQSAQQAQGQGGRGPQPATATA